jgi:magnesium-transporting ATPase (P-type)
VVPFDAAYKYMATFHNMIDDAGKPVVRCYVKGAPDVIFGLSRAVYWEGRLVPMGQLLERAQQANQQISAQGLRGMAVAVRDLDPKDFDAQGDLQCYVKDLATLGLVGIVDPPRPEDKPSIATAKNDAPSLKAADIGIAMGITGSEVSKQAAGMILADDNFATIVKAVEMGRGIYDNLMKYLRFQLMSLLAFIILFVGTSLLNIMGGISLQPLQVLWVNFAISIPLAIALGLDVETPGLMTRPPRKSDEQIMDLRKAMVYTIIGLVMAGGSILAAGWALGGWDALNASSNGLAATTLVLTTFSLTAIFSAIATRFDPETILSQQMLAGLLECPPLQSCAPSLIQ